ncbi:fasciclin domain-containing protein [Maribellus sp. CM-23]|uniref:fasciclin domain-containing protein n=1 Tax=Maribellus sp. CM-23 TaxID=2781026 RepID=UPI001F1CE7B8|nr:fasciclin domain-containing protein [Maribellus sp. CM-23]MCE4563668.1 fasciclin domain-containing protein [Maribellus sp. CM-23]
MKTLSLKKKLNLRILAFAGILAMAFFTISCEKETDDLAPASYEEGDLKAGKAVKKAELSIAEIALADDGEFDELVSALVFVDTELGTGLVDMFLNGTDQYTVFAPTDAAFEALYDVLGVGGITEVDPQTVLNVLLYHVTEGRRAANSVVPKNSPRTIETLLEGATFMVDSEGMIWAVGNQATIVTANISASNGIIHVIDSVILPISL